YVPEGVPAGTATSPVFACNSGTGPLPIGVAGEITVIATSSIGGEKSPLRLSLSKTLPTVEVVWEMTLNASSAASIIRNWTATVDELLSVSGSFSSAVTVAVLSYVPAPRTVAVTSMLNVSLASNDAIVKFGAVQAPISASTVVTAYPLGITSLTTTFDALDGPLFIPLMVKVTVDPSRGRALLTDFVMAKSALAVIGVVTSSLSSLFNVLLSNSFPEITV